MFEVGERLRCVLGVPAELGGLPPVVVGDVVSWWNRADGEPISVSLVVVEVERLEEELVGRRVEVPWRGVFVFERIPPECCSGPGGVFGCEEHRPRRQISDRPQA